MPTNDFLPFAINTDAGVMSQADYAARAGLGVVPGLADPDFANKAWRQSSVMAAMLGRVIAGEGLNALDNGEVDALKNNFLDALAARVLLKMQAINSAGGLEYRTDHDYVPGSIVLQSGIKYICLTSNGPSSTVKSPASDTTKTYWAAVVSMADVSSTGGAGKIPIATNEGKIAASLFSSSSESVRKFEDGTMFQHGRWWTDSNNPSVFTFPEAFIDVPSITIAFRSTTGADNRMRIVDLTRTTFSAAYVNADGSTVQGASFNFIALGRYK